MAAAMQSLKDGIPTVSFYTLQFRLLVPSDISQNAIIDTAKFSSMAGLTEGSSKVIWNRVRSKLAAQAGGDGALAPTNTPRKDPKSPKHPETPASKRKEAEDGETGETLSQKPCGKKKTSETVKEEDFAKEEEADEELAQDEAI